MYCTTVVFYLCMQNPLEKPSHPSFRLYTSQKAFALLPTGRISHRVEIGFTNVSGVSLFTDFITWAHIVKRPQTLRSRRGFKCNHPFKLTPGVDGFKFETACPQLGLMQKPLPKPSFSKYVTPIWFKPIKLIYF